MDMNKNSISDTPLIWETLRCCLRGELIKISSLKNKKQHQEENKLLTEIKLLRNSLSNEYKDKYDDIIRNKIEYKLKRAK